MCRCADENHFKFLQVELSWKFDEMLVINGICAFPRVIDLDFIVGEDKIEACVVRILV